MFATMTPFTPMTFFAPRVAGPRGDGAADMKQQQQQQQQRLLHSAAFCTRVASIARTQIQATTPQFGGPATIAPPSFLQLAAASTSVAPGFFIDATTTTTVTTTRTAVVATTASEATKPWDKTLIAITLPPIVFTKWTNIPHPRDPRRQRAIEREREEFRNKWNAGNVGTRRPGGGGGGHVESNGAPVIVGDNRAGTAGSSSLLRIEVSGSGERRDFPVWDSGRSFPSPVSDDADEELKEGDARRIRIDVERERMRSRSIDERRRMCKLGNRGDLAKGTKNLFSKPVKVGLDTELEKPDSRPNGRSDEGRRTRTRGKKKKRERRDWEVRDSTDSIPSPVTFDAEKELEKRDTTRDGSSDEGDRTRSRDSEERGRRRSGSSSEERGRRRSGSSSEERERRRSGSNNRRDRTRSGSKRKGVRSRSGSKKKRIRSRSGSSDGGDRTRSRDSEERGRRRSGSSSEERGRRRSGSSSEERERRRSGSNSRRDRTRSGSKRKGVRSRSGGKKKRIRSRSGSSDGGDRTRSRDSEERHRRRIRDSEERGRRRSGSSEERERTRSSSNNRRDRTRSGNKKKRIRSRSGSKKKRSRSRSGSSDQRDRTRSRSRDTCDRTRNRDSYERDRTQSRSSNKRNRTPRKDKRGRKRRSSWDVLSSPVLFDPDEELVKPEQTRKVSGDERDRTRSRNSEERDRTRSPDSEERDRKGRRESEERERKGSRDSEERDRKGSRESEERGRKGSRDSEERNRRRSGSSEEERDRTRAAKSETATAKSETEREAAEAKNETERAVATAKNETKREAAAAKNDTEREAATAKNETERAVATAKNETKREAATAKNDTERAVATAKNETERAAAEAKNETECEAAEAKNETERAAATAKNETERAATTAKNETEREAVTTKSEIESQERVAKNETESEERDPTRSASSEEPDRKRSASSEERDRKPSASSEEQERIQNSISEERDRKSSACSEEQERIQSSISEERDRKSSASSEEQERIQSSISEERDRKSSASSEDRTENNSSGHVGVEALDDAASARVDVVTPEGAGPGGLAASSQHSPSDDGKSSDDLHIRGGFTVPGTRKHVKKQPAECIESSSKKTVREDIADISNEKLSGSIPDEIIKKSETTPPAIRSVKSEVSSTATTTIPELLDEDVGGSHVAPFLGKKSRPTITLNLSSHGTKEAKKDDQKIRPVPEIRIADSSVPDNENSSKDSPKKSTSKRHRTKDTSTAKRPRIVEDVTCVEGTIIDKSAFSKKSEPSADLSTAKKQKCEEISDGTFSSDATKNTLDKKTEEISVEAPKRRRVHQKLRYLFGKTPTLSEIDEEIQLINETLPKKRRKESRLSLDSGVSLGEFNSERATASPDTVSREMREHSIGRQLSAEPEELISIKSEEKDNDEDPFVDIGRQLSAEPEELISIKSEEKDNDEDPFVDIGRQVSAEPEELISTKIEEKDSDEDPFARSMPLLDSQKNIGDESEDAISTSQPDSSTNFDDKSEANLGGKLTILITPMDTVGADSFPPMSLEIDVTDRSLVSTTTSTPELPIESKSAYETSEHDEDLSKLLEMDLKKDYHITQQGNTISIQEEANTRILPLFVVAVEEDEEIAPKITDVASVVAEGGATTSQTRCGPDAGIIIANRQVSTLQSQDLDDKTISSAMELCFNDKIVDSMDTRGKISVPTSPSTTQTRGSDQEPTNLPSATCNYDLKLDDKDFSQRTLISSAKEDNQLPSTSVDSASKLEETATEKQLPDVGEMQKAFSDVETIKKELSDVVDIEKELPEEENFARVEEPVNAESTDTQEQPVASPADLPATEKHTNPQISVPKIRLLHHSELGSRWCPTPINSNNSSIPAAQTFPQYQSQPSTTQIQGAINAGPPHPVSEIQPLQFVIMNAAPVQQSTNCCNFPQAQTLPNRPIQPRTTSSTMAPPTLATSQPQSNTGRNPTVSFTLLLGNIFQCLTALHNLTEIMQNYPVPPAKSPSQIQTVMNKYIFWLHNEMEILYNIMGTRDNRVVVNDIFQHYPSYEPPERRVLSVQIILNILSINDLVMVQWAQRPQTQGVQAVPAPPVYHQTAYSANVATSGRPQNTANSRNPGVNIAANVQPCASTSQPEFPRPQPKRKTRAPKNNGIFIKNANSMFTRPLLKKLNEQIAAYMKIYERQKILIQSIMSRERGRRIIPMPTAPVPLERNLVNRQTVLRQNPGPLPQQQNQTITNQRIVYANSTFVPLTQNISGTATSVLDQLTYAPLNLQAPSRGPISCSQSTEPVLPQDLTVRQRPSPSTGNLVFQNRTVRASNTDIPVLVQDINFQRETRRSPLIGNFVFQDCAVGASNTDIPVPVLDMNIQREMRRCPATVTSQQLRNQNFIGSPRHSPREMENIGAQIERRRSPSSSSQQNSPVNLNVYVDRANTAATMDNGLRLSPATSTNSTRNSVALAAANCGATLTNIQIQNGNIGVLYQEQRSPAATTIQQNHQSTQRNVPIAVADNVGASLQQQCSSATATDYGVTLDNIIRSAVINALSADDIGHQQELRLTPSASSVNLTQNSTAQPTNCSSIPMEIDNTDAPNQERSPAATLQQVTPQELICSNQRDNDDDDDDFVLRLSPGSPTEDITTESVGCDDFTGIPLESSPALIEHSPPEEIIVGINRVNVAPTENIAGAQHESQLCPSSAEEIVGDHQESAGLHSARNIAISVVSTDAQLDQPHSSRSAMSQIAVQNPAFPNYSSAKATDEDCDVQVAREQQEERQNAATPISGETVSGILKIVNEFTDNGLNMRVVDVLDELEALPSMAKGKRLKSSSSRSPAKKPQIAPNEADETTIQNKQREENNNCTSFQCEDESTVSFEDTTSTSAEMESTDEPKISNNEFIIVSGDSTIISSQVESTDAIAQEIEDIEAAVSAANPVAVITTDDDDDEEALESLILKDCEASKKSEDAAREAEKEIKREMLPECPVAAEEAEKGETDLSREIDDETPETFSILEVKSIPKDVFNNIGDSDQVESPQSSEIQETTDGVNIKDTGLSCSRCGKLSSVACSQCYSVSYCSIECHHLHWTEIHYLSCKPVPEEAQAQL